MPPDDSLRRVEVAVRVRAVPKSSVIASPSCVTLDEQRHVICVADTGSGAYSMSAAAVQRHEYKQDMLFDPTATNRSIYEQLVRAKMQRATPETPDTLCFLAYGHTSSGKTHSIAGTETEPGILTLCVEELLRRDGLVEVSMLEVYVDKVYDLLSDSAARRVRRRQSPSGPTIVVEELTTCSLVSLAQWNAVSTYGMRSRRTAATDRNARSSRSHAIFTVKSRGVRLCLVDLAGSERQTVFSPQLNKESIAINKSLSRLSTVLEALSTQRVRGDGTKSYVNFRDTVLTVLLQRYLSGASMTTFLACVHPAADFYQETLSTLRYTQRLKRIKTGVVRLGGPGDVSAMMPYVGAAEHEELLEELARLRAQVRASDQATQRIDQIHRQRIMELEASLEQWKATSAPPSSAAARSDQVNAKARVREQRAKETRRVAGWLLSRVLGDLPVLNVGYDDYFDRFIPRPLQVIGYVSTMSCLPPRPDNSGTGLAFLDVGDLSMGLSMVDAGIPPFVRLHRVPCTAPLTWESHDWDSAGHGVYVLCFFEADGEAVETADGDGAGGLPCCDGCVSCEALLPIATVLCVAATTPTAVKEEMLQWLIALQGEQEAACARRLGESDDSMTSFDGSLGAYLEGSLRRDAEEDKEAAAVADTGRQRARGAAALDSPTLTSSSSSVGGALSREVDRQSADASKLNTPFKDASTSPSSEAAVPPPHATSTAAAAAATAVPIEEEPARMPKAAPPCLPRTDPSEVRLSLKDEQTPPVASGAAAGNPGPSEEPLPERHMGKKHRKKRPTETDDNRSVRFESCHGCAIA